MLGGKRDTAGDPAARAGRDDAARPAERGDPEVERRILQAVRSLDYGSVEITVHDARVVQIERREKLRFDRPAAAGRPGRPGEPPPAPRSSGNRP